MLNYNNKMDLLFTKVNGKTEKLMDLLQFILVMEISSKGIIMKENNMDSVDLLQKIQFMKVTFINKECMDQVN